MAAEKADLVVKTFDEKIFDIKNFREGNHKKNVLVVFWAQWCIDCIREMPKIENLYKNCYRNLEVIGVSLDRRRLREKVLEATKNVTYPNAFLDDADENNFPDIVSVPALYLVDKEGFAEEINEVPKCSQLR